MNHIAEGFIFLRKSGRIDASKLLVRPLIETMFRVEAIQKKPELFYRIAYSETIVEDPKWIGSAATRAGATFDEAAHSKRFKEFKEQLSKQLPNVPLEDKYLSVWEIAEAAGMAGYYGSHYRTRALIAIDSMGLSRSSNKSEIMRFVFRSLQLLEIARFLVRCYHVDSSSLKLRTKNAERKAKAVRNAQTLFRH